ncbi:MAG TPA: anti-sigma factor antagonist [Nocardioidaceae bacterium]|nr:anti-sigma factor antagonist [Nocardioidaceae bacterium]
MTDLTSGHSAGATTATGLPGATAESTFAQQGMSFARVEHEGCTVVQAAGEVDLCSAPLMRQVLTGVASAQIVLDVREVTFMDAGGVNVLAGAHRDARLDGGCLRLVGQTGAVHKVMTITGLDQVVPVHATLTDAIGAACVQGAVTPGTDALTARSDRPADASGLLARRHRSHVRSATDRGAAPGTGPAMRAETNRVTATLGALATVVASSAAEQDAAQAIVDLAKAHLECDYAGVTVRRNRQLVSLATTDPLAAKCDELQDHFGEGPCVDALNGQHSFAVDDIASDPRWPRWGPAAAELGLASLLAVRMTAAGEAVGALNLYLRRPLGFTGDDAVFAQSSPTTPRSR